MSAYEATLAHEDQDAGTLGYYEVQGYWDQDYRERAHIMILELTTVRLKLEDSRGIVWSVAGKLLGYTQTLKWSHTRFQL